jgi:hypothetical protein
MALEPEQTKHNFHWLVSSDGLKPGVTIAQANAEVNNVARHIAEVYPKIAQRLASASRTAEERFSRPGCGASVAFAHARMALFIFNFMPSPSYLFHVLGS